VVDAPFALKASGGSCFFSLWPDSVSFFTAASSCNKAVVMAPHMNFRLLNAATSAAPRSNHSPFLSAASSADLSIASLGATCASKYSRASLTCQPGVRSKMNKRVIALTILPLCGVLMGAVKGDGVPTIGPDKGWLVVHGGGDVTNEVRERFVALAGGPHANFVLIPTAMADKEIDAEKMRRSFAKEYDVERVTVLHTRDRATANSAGFVESLRHATGVWIKGGRQWRLADAYLDTAVEREIKWLLARGGVVGGSSAGATIQGSFLVRGAPGTPRNPEGDNTIMMSPGHEMGFGLLANSAIDQHIDARGRVNDLHSVISAHSELLGIGIDQSAAIVVHGDSFFVVGGRVAIHDGKDHDGAPYYFLSSGQGFNLKTRSVDDPQTDEYPLTLAVTAANRMGKSRTVGSGVLRSRDKSQEPAKVQIECDVSLYSMGNTLYPARLEGSHEIRIKAREVNSDKLRELVCKVSHENK